MRARYLTRRRVTRTSIMPRACMCVCVFALHPRDFCVASARRSRDSWYTARRVVNLCGFAIPCLLPAGRTRSAIGNCKFCRTEQKRRRVSVGRRFLTDVIIINPRTLDITKIHDALRCVAKDGIPPFSIKNLPSGEFYPLFKGGNRSALDLSSIAFPRATNSFSVGNSAGDPKPELGIRGLEADG